MSDRGTWQGTTTVAAMLEDAPKLKDDGRWEVSLTPSIYRRLSRFIPDQKTAGGDPEEGGMPDSPPKYDDLRPERFPTQLNIVIQVVGSRGDVQPFVALGTQLLRYGHRVRLATHDVFRDFVRKSSPLEFFPIGGDPADLMAYMMKNPGLMPSMKSFRAGDIQRKRRMVGAMLDGCWRSCIDPDPDTGVPFVADAIIANPPSFAHIHCAEELAIPLHLMFTMPWSPTRAYSHPLVDVEIKSPNVNTEVANYLSYGIVEWMTWQGLGDVINEWRETMGLEPIAFLQGYALLAAQKIPFTYCWSPSLLPKAFDWPAHIDVCGFFFRDIPDFEPDKQLRQFLAAGPPPVYIGFGSIVIDEPSTLTSIIVNAATTTGVRAVVSRGWSKLGLIDGREIKSDKIFLLDDCPHEWLFQQVAVVVHHGGAGTTACGLRFGVPTTVVPFFGDQMFWGRMVATAGAGPKPIPHGSLNSDNLADAIRFCLKPQALAAAKAIADKMRSESGVLRAVQSFHAQLAMEEQRCDILPGLPAAWKYRGRKARLKLSKLACEILKEHLKVASPKVTLNARRPIRLEPVRWDPVTSTTSAALGFGLDMTKAVFDVVAKPVKAYRQASARDSGELSQVVTTASQIDRQDYTTQHGAQKSNLACPTPTRSRSCGMPLGAAAEATISSLGGLLAFHAKGIFIDVPLATTEGLRAVPRLYGQDVRQYGPICDWKSGVEVAGKNFAYGLAEGVADLFVEPVRGAYREGTLGAAKGLGKGLLSAGTKIPSAGLGLLAYTGQGIYKSVNASARTKTRDSIRAALEAEGQHFLQTRGDRQALTVNVLGKFRSMSGRTP